ncbi:MAG: short-chain dehydrogenase/reductase [Gammaproteobacteria bacterium]|nr:short-chain dehydrogenase/reductase [Gammaproteobacteria bacterium]
MRVITNKVAFVTGGASGIGLGIVRRLLAHGARVVVADLRADYLAEARELLGATDTVEYLQVDVCDRNAMAAAAEATVRRFGKAHILVNNAGVGTCPPVEQMSYADWDWVLAVNLGGTINGIMSFLPHLLAHGEGGHILTTASMAGLIPTANNFIYAASKYGVRGLSDSLRLTLASRGIGVSVLYPGLTRSRMLQSEENRQPRFARPAPVGHPPGPLTPPPEAGMDPYEIGEIVVQGILHNTAYILSHGEFRDELAEHFTEILASFPQGQVIDPGRQMLEAARRAETAAAKRAIEAMDQGRYE